MLFFFLRINPREIEAFQYLSVDRQYLDWLRYGVYTIYNAFLTKLAMSLL